MKPIVKKKKPEQDFSQALFAGTDVPRETLEEPVAEQPPVEQALAPKAQEEKPGKYDDVLAQAIASFAPTLFGGILAGSEGATAGSVGGAKAGQALFEQFSDKEKTEKALAADKEKQKELQAFQAGQQALEAGQKQKQFEDTQKLEREKMAQNERLKQMELSAKRIEAQEKAAEGVKGTIVPGFILTQGSKPTAEDAKQVKAANASAAKLRLKAEQLKDLIKQHGTEAFGATAKEMKQLVTDLQFQVKNMQQLGQLSGSDIKMTEDLIPDPTAGNSVFYSNDSYLNLLTKLQKSALEDLNSVASAYGYEDERAEAARELLAKRQKEKQTDIAR